MYCTLSLYLRSICVCCVEFDYFELLSISALDYSDELLSFCNNYMLGLTTMQYKNCCYATGEEQVQSAILGAVLILLMF